MTDRRGDRPPPFAVELIERAMRREPDDGLEAWAARLIAATLATGDRPALSSFARTGELDAEALQAELAALHRTFRPAWLAALKRYVAAVPPSSNAPERR